MSDLSSTHLTGHHRIHNASPLTDQPTKQLEDAWGVSIEQARWVEEFTARHKRPPRVLGIGNIANNAFKNALALRQHGIECDVICPDYYHAMGSPEWETATFNLGDVSVDAPNWKVAGMPDDFRPRWFAQGSLATSLEYLLAYTKRTEQQDELWAALRTECESGGRNVVPRPPLQHLGPIAARVQAKRFAEALARLPNSASFSAKYFFDVYQSVLVDQPRWRDLLSRYDAVIGYATSGFFPLLADTPFIAYEHGTIRVLPFEDTLAGGICHLVYCSAETVLITNSDNIVAADRLGLSDRRFIPHAILEDWRDEPSGDLRKSLLTPLGYDFLVFHPARQHWTDRRDTNMEKSNDVLIRGFAKFVRTHRPKALLLLVRWGDSVSATEQLVRQLSLEANVRWIEPVPIRELGRIVAASDVLADQFLIGAWGAIMPIGLMFGKPTLSYVNESVHAWCFPVMPPILNVRTEDEVAEALALVGSPPEADRIGRLSRAWYDDYHSMNVVAGRLINAVQTSISETSRRSAHAWMRDDPQLWIANSVDAKLDSLHLQNEALRAAAAPPKLRLLVRATIVSGIKSVLRRFGLLEPAARLFRFVALGPRG